MIRMGGCSHAGDVEGGRENGLAMREKKEQRRKRGCFARGPCLYLYMSRSAVSQLKRHYRPLCELGQLPKPPTAAAATLEDLVSSRRSSGREPTRDSQAAGSIDDDFFWNLLDTNGTLVLTYINAASSYKQLSW